MARRTIQIKVAGSGSCQPLAPEYTYGLGWITIRCSATSGGYQGFPPTPGISLGSSPHTVVLPDGTQKDLWSWCDENGISWADFQRLEQEVEKLGPGPDIENPDEYMALAFCEALFCPRVVLHNHALQLKLDGSGRALMHVRRGWAIHVAHFPIVPPSVEVSIDVPKMKAVISAAAYYYNPFPLFENANGEATREEFWGRYNFLPWPPESSPFLQNAEHIVDGEKVGEVDLMAYDNGGPKFFGAREELFDRANFRPSGNTGYPLKVGDQNLRLPSLSAAVEFLDTVYFGASQMNWFPDPVASGEPNLPGWYKQNGKVVIVQTMFKNGHPRILLGSIPYNYNALGDGKIRVTKVASDYNGGQPFEVDIYYEYWRTGREFYGEIDVQGTLLNTQMFVTAYTGNGRGDRLPANSYIMVALAGFDVRFNNPGGDVPCTLDHDEVVEVGDSSVRVYYYKVECSDIFEKDGAFLAPGQTKTIPIPCDSDSPYSGTLYLRPGVDFAAAWNRDPDISPSLEVPDFDEWVEPDAYQESPD